MTIAANRRSATSQLETSPGADRVALDVRPLSGTIGAEIVGLDVRDLDDVTIAAIRRVWLERKVVFFPGQDLTPAEHVEFAQRFGEVTEGHPVVPGLDDQPEVFEINYTDTKKLAALYGELVGYGAVEKAGGLGWHTDVTFVERPPLGSILRAVHTPAHGGDTLFSDQVAAFESLSPALQGFLSTLTAVHDGRHQFQALLDKLGEGRWNGEKLEAIPPVEHPVVRTHPETGKQVLFVNPGFTSHIKELSKEESTTLLNFLYDHSTKAEHTVRYHWTPGAIGFWDNRATQHSVVGDYGDQHRVIQRVVLRGDKPF